MRIGAYMLSCPERAAMRRRTLANLQLTDWADTAWVELDPGTAERKQDRQTQTALRLLERAAGDGHDFMLFLEDDLEFNRYLRHNLERWQPLRDAARAGHFFASLYNPNVRSLMRGPDQAFFVADPNSVYGSQAFLLSWATARHIVTHWDDVIGMQDIKMSRLAAGLGPIYYHVPSLVQHIGTVSAWGGVFHSAPDFDAEWKAGARTEAAVDAPANSALTFTPLTWAQHTGRELRPGTGQSALPPGFRPLRWRWPAGNAS